MAILTFLAGNRRKQTLLIIISAIVPFTFIIVWLLAGSGPSVPHTHSPATPDHHHDTAMDHHDAVLDHHDNPSHDHDLMHDHDDTKADHDEHDGDSHDENVVKASTGQYVGKIDKDYDNVREFLKVPYSLPPTGDKRFMPPVALSQSDKEIDATAYGKVCPQFVSDHASIWPEQIPWYRIPHSTTGETADTSDEDCLSLAIWAPKNATADSNLPVAMFWPGGGFQTNGILVPAHIPAEWVARSQTHIVVTINYRLSILGFPNAAGAEKSNLGLLDQRLALEWVRDNIGSFGGDASRILVWGFSAGAQSVDFHNYAHWEDPIAHAYFAQSGSCLAFGSGQSDDHSKFTFVAKKLGCDYPEDAAQELQCMQQVNYKEIIDFIGQYHGDLRLRFGPVTDERMVFSDYKSRYNKGEVSKIPMIYSSCANDGASLAAYDTRNPEIGPNQEAVNAITKRIMCGAAESSKLRHDAGLVSYRYQYAGVWPNQNPLSWMGAYHSSDLVMFFGTHDDFGGSASTSLEIKTSEVMQDLLLAFLKDPHDVHGWTPFDPSAEDGGTILRFGAHDQAVQNVSANSVESICSGEGTYEPFP